MTRWFRFYDDAMNDPKLLRLSDEHYRAWSVLLCVASKNGGSLPPVDDIALTLRLKAAKIALWITVLVKGGLIDNVDGVFSPHNWASRQFKSDGSTERVKRFREQDKAKKRNVSETLHETGPEAEQSQNRAEAEQSARDVSNSEKVLRTDLMDAFGEKRCPDLTRASDWIAKGYAPSMIIEVVRELLGRKPDIASLAYFDNALAERHASRAELPSERAAAEKAFSIEDAVKSFVRTGKWSRYAGPEPGQAGCKASVELLASYGLDGHGQKIRKAG